MRSRSCDWKETRDVDCSSVLLGDLPGADIVKGTGTRIARLSVEADIKKTLRGFN